MPLSTPGVHSVYYLLMHVITLCMFFLLCVHSLPMHDGAFISINFDFHFDFEVPLAGAK